jgi:hypothetical protein
LAAAILGRALRTVNHIERKAGVQDRGHGASTTAEFGLSAARQTRRSRG